MTSNSDKTTANDDKKLGTFAGVFTPSILTILGIILFLRLGFVVGCAGLMQALIIIGIANLISVLTSISLSAVATNLKVKGGGDYYLISRTLGVEFGGALGIVLFLAQSVSIAFYCIGFGEAVAAFSDHPMASPQIIAFGAVAVLFLFAWLGADWATRFQFGVMAFLAAALLSFYLGALAHWNGAFIAANWSTPGDTKAFWVLFAIFFPAVTGFTQGVSMSGDLADPVRSLPLGTFAAVGLSIVVYFSVAVLFAGALPLSELSTNTQAMKQVSRWGVLIDAGVIAATLSSAMASFLGAPRILQSLAGDRVFPFLVPFAKGYGAGNNPRRAVLLAMGIALATVAMGNLNLVASVVSMFFLISYGLLNYATYYEAKADSPSFRPRFRFFHRWISLGGALACLGAMLAIDPVTGVVAVSIIFAIYHYLKRTAGPARWADSRRSHHLHEIKEHLAGLAENPEHPRDWRPFILALSNDPERRRRLLQLADWIAGRSGFTTAVRIMESRAGFLSARQREAEQALRADIAKQGSAAFARVICAPEPLDVLATLVQAHGVGALKPNTILLNWYSAETEADRPRLERMIRILRGAYRLGCNILISQVNEAINLDESTPDRRRIDIWWRDDATGRLALLMAHLMRQTTPWSDARLTVLTVDARHMSDQGRDALAREIEEARIDAVLEIPETPDMKQVVERSAQSDMVFLPFRFKRDQLISLFDRPVAELMRWMTTTVLIQAAEDIDLDAEPEEGAAGERAEVLDTLEQARKSAAEARKEADAQQEKADLARMHLAELQASAVGSEDDALKEAAKAVEQIRAEAEKTARKAAKAGAKLTLAEQAASDLDPQRLENQGEADGEQ